jgi:hypothetical protein
MLKTPNLKESEKEYYTINNFRNELKSLDENKNYLNNENTKFSKIKSSNIKNNKYNSLRKNTNFETINEEILKNEIINMKTENEELKFCLNSIIKLLNKKLFKILSNNNINISLNDDKTSKRPSLSSLIISDTTRGKRKDNNTNINHQNFEENININNKNQYEIEQSFNL